MPAFTPSHPRIHSDINDPPCLKRQAHQAQLDIERGEVWRRQNLGLRAKVLRRINALKAATKNLPPEILSLIFQYATPHHGRSPSVPQHQATFKIAHVCSRWREIAWSTAEMWTLFQCRSLREWDSQIFLEVLQLYFTNVGHLKISLDLSFDEIRPLPPHLTQSIDQLLLEPENASKIVSLTLNNINNDQIPSTFSFPNLEALSLEFFRARYPIDLSTLPRLSKLTLRELSSPIPIPCSQITTLELTNVHINICANFLKSCPQLVTFTNSYDSRFVNHSSDIDFDPWPIDLTLQNMKTFTWTYINHPTSDIVLLHIRLPVVQTVRWAHGDHDAPRIDLYPVAIVFYSNLPKTVITLAFERLSLPFSEFLLKYAFSTHSQIQEVILEGCTSSSLVNFFTCLIPWKTPANHDDGNLHLPSLEAVSLVKGSYRDEKFRGPLIKTLTPSDFEYYLLLISRHLTQSKKTYFRLNLIDVVPESVVDVREMEPEIWEMRKEGLKIEIFSNGEALSW